MIYHVKIIHGVLRRHFQLTLLYVFPESFHVKCDTRGLLTIDTDTNYDCARHTDRVPDREPFMDYLPSITQRW